MPPSPWSGSSSTATVPIVRRGPQRVDVVVVDEDEARDGRAERLAVARRAGGGDGGEGAAVERVVGGDDLEAAVFVLLAPLARELDRGLVRLCAGVREEDPVEARVRRSAARPARSAARCRRCSRRGRACAPAPRSPRRGRRRSDRARWTAMPATKSRVLLAVLVPDAGTLATHERYRQAASRLHVQLGLAGLDVAHLARSLVRRLDDVPPPASAAVARSHRESGAAGRSRPAPRRQRFGRRRAVAAGHRMAWCPRREGASGSRPAASTAAAR